MLKAKDTKESEKEARLNDSVGQAKEEKIPSKIPKKKIISGVLHIEATFNNTKVLFSFLISIQDQEPILLFHLAYQCLIFFRG